MSETTLAASNAAYNYTLKNNEDGSFAIKRAAVDQLVIDGNGNVGIGVTPNPSWQSPLDVMQFAANACIYVNNANGNINYATNILSDGASKYAATGYAVQHSLSQTTGVITTNTYQSGTAGAALVLAAQFRIDQASCLMTTPNGGLGYGTGAGGTVTQLTNKSTPVTLNKPTGQITMHNAALAAATSVQFVLNNTVIGAYDTVILAPNNNSGAYVVTVTNVISGAVAIRVTNVSGGSLSDAVPINFSVIKGAIS